MIGSKVQMARKLVGLSQADAARRGGMSRQQWHQWESGIHTPGYKSMDRIATVLGTTVIGLLSLEA